MSAGTDMVRIDQNNGTQLSCGVLFWIWSHDNGIAYSGIEEVDCGCFKFEVRSDREGEWCYWGLSAKR